MKINYVNLIILLIIWCILAYNIRKWNLILDKNGKMLDGKTKDKTKDS